MVNFLFIDAYAIVAVDPVVGAVQNLLYLLTKSRVTCLCLPDHDRQLPHRQVDSWTPDLIN